jgi:hypothetical protein
LTQPVDGRVEGRQRLVRVGGVDHPVALRAKVLDVLLAATFLAWEAMVFG